MKSATTRETIRLQGRDVPFERGYLSVDQLELDPANPRLQYLIGRVGQPVTQAKLDEMLWEKDKVKQLSESIRQNEGVYEHLIVQKVNGKYLVREGNCRTAASRHLAQTHEGDQFSTVPAMIFDAQLSDEDLAVLLADMHVTGKIRWDAYEQAKHVSDLYNTYGKPYEWLANHLRLSKSRIAQDLKAYKWTSEFLHAHPDAKNVEKFAFFQELARKKHLVTRYEDDPDFRQQFTRWLVERKLTASAQVRKLDLILKHDEATKVLDEDGYEEAAKVLVREDPSLGSNLYAAVQKATEQLRNAPVNELDEIPNNAQKRLLLRNLQRAIEDLATRAGLEKL